MNNQTENGNIIEISELNKWYGDFHALKNINLDIKEREIIVVCRPSGSGKSTLADLLARFYDSEDGDILIDNNNIKDIALDDLRRLMGIVSQESILFNDSIYNNIRLGKLDASNFPKRILL